MLYVSLGAVFVAVLALLVAVASYRLGLRNARSAEPAPGRARQQGFRDQIRTAVEPLPAELRSVVGRVGSAHEAGEVPATLKRLYERLTVLAKQLADRPEADRVHALKDRLGEAEIAWTRAARAERVPSEHDDPSVGPPAPGSIDAGKSREQLVRSRDLAHDELRAAASETATRVENHLARVDQYERWLAGGR